MNEKTAEFLKSIPVVTTEELELMYATIGKAQTEIEKIKKDWEVLLNTNTSLTPEQKAAEENRLCEEAKKHDAIIRNALKMGRLEDGDTQMSGSPTSKKLRSGGWTPY